MSDATVFMNEHIHAKGNTEPVVTIVHGKQRIHVNEIEINGLVRLKTGRNEEITSHTVKAWIECDFDDIQVLG